MTSFTDSFPAIPDELKALPQWVCWRWETRDGKPTKIPYQARTPEREAKSNDKRTWASFAQAVRSFEQAKQNGHALDGIGFVVTNNDPLVGIDLDKCLNPDTGEIEAWAQEILAAFDSYTEVTPSGKGFRIWLEGKLPPGGRRKGKLEMYNQGRFFTLTGQRLPDKPAEIRDCQQTLDALHARAFPKPKKPTPPPRHDTNLSLTDAELIEKACKAKNGADFQALWRGDTSAFGNDHSGADLALCSHLLFWTNGDVGRADQLFRQSGLMRPKWDKRHSGDGRSYGQMTLEKALEGFQEGYSGRREHKATGGGCPTAGNPPVEVYEQDFNANQDEGAAQSGDPSYLEKIITTALSGIVTADVFARQEFPPIRWAVEDILPAGLTLFAGPPKIGKTRLAFNIALAVACGGNALGNVPVEEGEVLYIVRDDPKRRLHDMLLDTCKQMEIEPPSNLHLVFDWPLLGQGCEECLDR